MKTLTTVLLLFTLAGCGVTLKNHTPADFPYDVFSGIRVRPNGIAYSIDYDPLITTSTINATPYELISKLEEYPRHRFYLTAMPGKLAKVKSVFVMIDSTAYPMERYPENISQFWHYAASAECAQVYNYHFQVNYKSGIFNRTAELRPPRGEFRAKVDKYGELNNHHNKHKDANGYFRTIPGLGFNYTGEYAVNINLISGESQSPVTRESTGVYSRVIKLQNLTKEKVRIDRIFLDSTSLNIPLHRRVGAIFNNSEFQLEMDVKSLPKTLACGEYFYVKVKWTNSRPFDTECKVDGAIGIQSSFITGPYTGYVAFGVTKMIYAGNSIAF